jgi:hypothetical protein
MRKASLLCAVGLAAGLAGCAGPSANGAYQSNASYEQLYAAALAAVPAVGFTVTNASKADGLIVAQQGVVLGHGSSVGLNVSIAAEGAVRVMQVNFTAPPASLALGNFDQNVTDYVTAVKRRVPDLRAYP